MSTKVVGRDASVFSVTPLNENGDAGNTTSMLGRWKSLEINVENVWGDLTSSDAEEPEERYLMEKWSGSIKGFVDGQGSTALDIVRARYLMVLFTEVKSGKTMRAYGGVDKGGASFEQSSATDSIEFSSKGKFNGQPSLSYI